MSNTVNEVNQGRVKWFNNRAGYGFITIVKSDNEDVVGKEIFAHHSGINVSDEQYKYLMQGEYVEFVLSTATEGEHEFQAVNINGIAGGKLMCETRAEIKQLRAENDDYDNRGGREDTRGDNRRGYGRRVRMMGGGSRDGEVWRLVKDNDTRRSRPRQNKHTDTSENN